MPPLAERLAQPVLAEFSHKQAVQRNTFIESMVVKLAFQRAIPNLPVIARISNAVSLSFRDCAPRSQYV